MSVTTLFATLCPQSVDISNFGCIDEVNVRQSGIVTKSRWRGGHNRRLKSVKRVKQVGSAEKKNEVEEREGVMEGGRQANEMGFTDEGRHGRGERRETSKDFTVTAFHTDNSASATPHTKGITHAHICT